MARIGLGVNHTGFEKVHVRLEPCADVNLSLLLKVGNVGSIEKTAIMQEGISWMQVLRGF
jgi:hypothetical protein